jgi:hypothetical protein
MLRPSTGHQARLEAAAKRRLYAVACMPSLGQRVVLPDLTLFPHTFPDHCLIALIVAGDDTPNVEAWARCFRHLGSRRGRLDQGSGRALPGTGASNAFSIIATIV